MKGYLVHQQYCIDTPRNDFNKTFVLRRLRFQGHVQSQTAAGISATFGNTGSTLGVHQIKQLAFLHSFGETARTNAFVKPKHIGLAWCEFCQVLCFSRSYKCWENTTAVHATCRT